MPFWGFILCDEDAPPSSGGTAHYLFETNVSNIVQKYVGIYNANAAELELDEFLDRLKRDSRLPKEVWEELEKRLAYALIVFGRRLLDNAQILVRKVNSEMPKFLRTGGDPFYLRGKVAGLQNFTLTAIDPDELQRRS